MLPPGGQPAGQPVPEAVAGPAVGRRGPPGGRGGSLPAAAAISRANHRETAGAIGLGRRRPELPGLGEEQQEQPIFEREAGRQQRGQFFLAGRPAPSEPILAVVQKTFGKTA